jgi:hypothetical protein
VLAAATTFRLTAALGVMPAICFRAARSADNGGKAAKPGQQRLGQRFGIAAGNAAEQQQLQQLIIGQLHRQGTLL